VTVTSGAENTSATSPLHGPYLASNPLLLAALRSVDALLGIARPRRQVAIPRAPRRVLLALGGHLGDAVVATAAIHELRASLPEAQIGVLLPSWSRPVLSGDPRLHWIHTIDHWKSSRAKTSRAARWRRYRETRRAALREIRAIGYDVAIDLYGYFPNMALVLHRAGIPVRLGFPSGGFGPLYTHPFPWSDDQRHVADRQVELVRQLAPRAGNVRPLRYSLSRRGQDPLVRARVDALFAREKLTSGDYIVIHMGAGAAERVWRESEWTRVAARLATDGHSIAFTGRGEVEGASIRAASRGLPRAVDLCDRLSWDEFVHVIAEARLVLTVETVAAHVAAATDTPCVAIWSGITSAHHWGPLASNVSLLTEAVPCAPCFRSRGCPEMSCVQRLTADDVLQAAHRMLEISPRAALAAERHSPRVAP
jgi:ADP-heptose:LPS heptosyltransferase